MKYKNWLFYLQDGATWLLNPPEQSLAMILADNGFDVWISNIRGTRYSRRHVTLDPNDSVISPSNPERTTHFFVCPNYNSN